MDKTNVKRRIKKVTLVKIFGINNETIRKTGKIKPTKKETKGISSYFILLNHTKLSG